MENSLLEILTYYVIGGALLVGAPGIFFLIVFMPALPKYKGYAWLVIKITNYMVILQSMRIHPVIQASTI